MPFSDESQYSGAALGTSAAAQPPVSGHPASRVSFTWQEDRKEPVGDWSPKAHPHRAHVLLPGAQGWGGCSVQLATWAALGVTVLCRVVCGSASHCCLSSGIYCKQGFSLYFINISKSVSISHIWVWYCKILFKTKLISNIKNIEEDGSFFLPEEVLMCTLESSSFFPNSLFLSGPINLAYFAEQPYRFSRKQTASLFSLLCPSSPYLQQLRLNLVVRDRAGAVDLNPLTLRRLLNRSQLTSFWVTALTTDIRDEQQHHHHPSLKNKE